MVKHLLLLLSLFSFFSTFATKVLNPYFDKCSNETFKIDSITSLGSETFFYCHYQARTNLELKSLQLIVDDRDTILSESISCSKVQSLSTELVACIVSFPRIDNAQVANAFQAKTVSQNEFTVEGILLNAENNRRVLLFNKAEEYYYANLLESSKELYKKLLENPLDTTDLIYGECLLKIPLIYAKLKKWNEAKMWYEKLMNSNVSDSLETKRFSEMYSNFKHHAALGLANIHTVMEDYDLALEYIRLAKERYPYIDYDSITPNSIQDRVDVAIFESFILQKNNMPKDAFHRMLGEIVNMQVPQNTIVGHDVLAPYRYLNHTFVVLLKSIYGKEAVRKEFENAFSKKIFHAYDTYSTCAYSIFDRTYIFSYKKNDKSIKVDSFSFDFLGYETLVKNEEFFDNIFKNKPFFKRLYQVEAIDVVDTNNVIYFQNRLFNGVCNEYFDNGKISAVGKYHDGVLNGIFTAYHENGEKYYEGSFVNGKEVGEFVTYYKNGNVKEKGSFKAGKRTGTWVSWYDIEYVDKTGEISSDVLNDSLHFQQIEWKVKFHNDKENGLWQSWHPNGQLREQLLYVNGVQEGEVRNWYSNGQLQMEGEKQHGEFNGICKTYYEGGNVQTIVDTKLGKFNGELLRFYENGNKKEKCIYIMDMPEGKCVEWYENGQQRVEFNFTNGKFDGEWTLWDLEGNVVKHGVYKDGELIKGDSAN